MSADPETPQDAADKDEQGETISPDEVKFVSDTLLGI
jgi:hypothetical protein